MDVYKEAENALCSFYEGMGGWKYQSGAVLGNLSHGTVEIKKKTWN